MVNEAFFYISQDMAEKGITQSSIIDKRVKSIIDQANLGKDDIVNRSLMTVSCR
jgi:adenylate kinase family enzyme